MKRTFRLPALLCLGAAVLLPSAAWTAAAPARQQPASPERIERLVGLCKLWGTVKWFHPTLAHRKIDWDQALVNTLPKVDAATSDAEYAAAVQSMLAVLQDPDTRVLPASAPQPASKPQTTAPSLRWTDDRVAILSIPDARHFIGTQAASAELVNLIGAAESATRIVIDLRQVTSGEEGAQATANFWFTSAMAQALPLLFTQEIAEAALRYRMHSGFAPQAGNSSGGYYSAFVVRDGSYTKGRQKSGPAKTLAFIIDASASPLLGRLSGMQSAGFTRVIQAGPTGGSGGPVTPINLPGVDAQVRVGEFINADGSMGFQPDVTVPSGTAGPDRAMDAALKSLKTPAASRPARALAPQAIAQRENFYSDTPYPDREHRLLALFRLWVTMEYFFPYKHLMDRPWDEVLAEYIPRFEQAGDALQYGRVASDMVRNLQDSHVSAYNPALRKAMGNHQPAIEVKFVEGQSVVARLWGDARTEAPQLKVGDILTAVDGEDASSRRKKLGAFYTYSTPQGEISKVNRGLISGEKDSKATLSLKDRDGKPYTVTLTRSQMGPAGSAGPSYKILPQGYGYIDLTLITAAELDAAFDALKDTPGLILDMRGYPRGVFFRLPAYFARKPATAALFERPEPHGVALTDQSRKKFSQNYAAATRAPYAGKVAMLINEQAISQSEHTCLFMETLTQVTFIGSPTTGANGDVTSVGLPGDIFVNFTGHDVRHADGRQLQRIGIQPDIKAEPTIAGLRAGRDEVLEKAVEFLGRK